MAIDIRLRNLGTVNKNEVTIQTPKGQVSLYFSYQTIVAVDGLVSENDWGKTTGKLLNELNPDKKTRVPHEQVLAKAQEQLRKIL